MAKNKEKCTEKKQKILINAIKLQDLLKSQLQYNSIKKQIKQASKKSYTVVFNNEKYSLGQEFFFLYSYDEAVLVLKQCRGYNSIFELLKYNYFIGELNLHKSKASLDSLQVKAPYTNDEIEEQITDSPFYQSNLDSLEYFNSLEISTWSYEDFVISAIYCCLQTLYDDYVIQQKEADSILPFLELPSFINKLPLLFLKPYGKKLFSILKKTNLFNQFPKECLSAVLTPLQETDVSRDFFTNKTESFFFKNLHPSRYNLRNINLFLDTFDLFIPKSVREIVYRYSYFTETINVLIWVLIKYQNSFDLENDQEFDIGLSNLIDAELNNQITKIIDELQ